MMHGNILMVWGVIPFGISTLAYDQLSMQTEFKWAKQSRIGQMPIFAYLEKPFITCQIEGTLFKEFGGGAEQLEQLKALAGLGKPQILVAVSGKVFGFWVVESVKEIHHDLNQNATPQRLNFTLSLTQTDPTVMQHVNLGVSVLKTLKRVLP